MLLKPRFWYPIGRLFKAFKGNYRYFSAEILYSFQWDFQCLGDFLTLTTMTFQEIIFGNPGGTVEKLHPKHIVKLPLGFVAVEPALLPHSA